MAKKLFRSLVRAGELFKGRSPFGAVSGLPTPKEASRAPYGFHSVREPRRRWGSQKD